MMNTNALQLMILPVVSGVCLGVALGTAGLMALRLLGALAGRPSEPAPRSRPRGGEGWPSVPSATRPAPSRAAGREVAA